MHVESWNILPGPDFGNARVGLAMSSRDGLDHRLQDLAALPAIGSRLQIRLAGPRRRILFDGYVTKHIARAGPDIEQLDIEVEDTLSATLNMPVTGRWQVSGTSIVFVNNEKCIFNDEGEGLASFDKHLVNSRFCRVFQSAPAGQLWSIADILGYLLAAHVPADVEVPASEELENVAGGVYPRRTALTGLTLREAIAKVAGLGGLAIRGSVNSEKGAPERGLVFYRPGRIGRRRAVRLQRYGEKLDIRRSDLWKGRIAIQRRPARRGVLVLGDWKQYESTFELKRGWNLNLESYEYPSFTRSEASNWLALKEVFRKWVLNESGAYCGEPHSLGMFDFSGISGDDFFLSISRRFKPCRSIGPDGKSLGIVVEVSYDDGSNWKRYGGPVRVSTDECAIYLADDALPADYFQAALNHVAKLRVTATVVSDRRIGAQANGDAGCGLEIVEVPKARWAKVHTGSIFYQSQELPAPSERDDTIRLLQMANSLSESQAGAIEAELALGWLDPNWNVGDIVERIEGRELGLTPFPGAAPHVQAVAHQCGEEWRTRLTVSG